MTRHVVMIRNPDNTRTARVQLPAITGMTWDDIETSIRKRSFAVKPSMIKSYIEIYLKDQP